MTRLLGIIAGLLSLSITAQAQVLPPGAADCTLNLISFKAWAVTGLNETIAPEMLPSWRNYVAYRYPTLPDRYSVANACWEYNNITTKWPGMAPVEREMWQNIWETSLPQDLDFIQPVFPYEAVDLRHGLLKRVAERLRETPQTAAPSGTQDNSQAALIELQRRYQIGQSLLRFDQSFYH